MKCHFAAMVIVVSLALVGCNQTQPNPTPTGATTPAPVATAAPAESPSPGVSATAAPSDAPEIAHTLTPLRGKEKMAPKITKKQTVTFRTTAGEVVMEIYPEAAPNAAARFVELSKAGFYDETPVSRVVKGFVAQFGVNWRDPHKAFKEKTFNDDPSYFAIDRGTLAFAKAGPNTNSTQVFISYGDNSRLASPQMNFTTFGKVVKGMDVVDKFVVVGDPSGGLNQQRLWADGAGYIESLDVKPTMIEKATVAE